jgi:phosphate/sulfate permease
MLWLFAEIWIWVLIAFALGLAIGRWIWRRPR